MTKSHQLPSNRISLRAVASGALVTFSLMLLLGAIGGSFRLWHFDIEEITRLGTDFWIFAGVAWTASVFCGSFVSSAVGRVSHLREGMLCGLVTWASVSVVTYGWLTVIPGSHWLSRLMSGSQTPVFAIIIGNIVSLAAAIYGGRKGAVSEARAERRDRELDQYLAA